jgi:hypothetical protein
LVPTGSFLLGPLIVTAEQAALVAAGAVNIGLALSAVELAFWSVLQLADVTANFIMFSAIFGYVTVIATIGAMKSLSEFLGGDIEIAGLSQFI